MNKLIADELENLQAGDWVKVVVCDQGEFSGRIEQILVDDNMISGFVLAKNSYVRYDHLRYAKQLDTTSTFLASDIVEMNGYGR